MTENENITDPDATDPNPAPELDNDRPELDDQGDGDGAAVDDEPREFLPGDDRHVDSEGVHRDASGVPFAL